MHSFAKLSLLVSYLVTFNNYVSGQTTVSSLYFPSLSDSGGLDDGSFLIGSLVGTQDGTSTYVLLLGSTDTDADDGPTPTITLVEASTTAHAFGAAGLDDEGDALTIDIQCTINGELSTCEEVAGVVAAGVTVSASTSAFTETVSPVPVTLVNALPSITSNSAQPTSGSSSSSSGSSSSVPGSSSSAPGSSSNSAPASAPQVTSGNTPSTPSGSSSNGTTPAPAAPGPASSSSTTPSPKPNSAIYHTASVLLCAFPLAAVSMLL